MSNDDLDLVPEEAVVEREEGVGGEKQKERGEQIKPRVVLIFFNCHLTAGFNWN